MTDLSIEYHRRHKLPCISPAINGLLFFKENTRPALILLTSTFPKNITYCSSCKSSSTLVAECFLPNKEYGHCLESHNHICPNTDLIKWISNKFKNLEAVKISNGTEIETWLWSFFYFNSFLRNYERFKSYENQQDPIKTYNMLCTCAFSYPESFEVYYKTYKLLTCGRKYLYFE